MSRLRCRGLRRHASRARSTPRSFHGGAPLHLHPQPDAAEQWTDNFFLENVGKTDNFRTTLALGLALLINLPNTQGSISTSLAGAYDTAPDTENFNFFPDFHATVTHTFTPRLNLVVSEDFRRGDDPLFADPNGLRRNRETFVTNTLSVSLNWLVDIFRTQIYYRNLLFFSDSRRHHQPHHRRKRVDAGGRTQYPHGRVRVLVA
jgi:hypothetical protein